MLQRARPGRVVHVLATTPSGETGQGGVDRIMASLKHELARRPRADIDLRFLATRGNGHVALSSFNILAFCLAMLAGRLRGKVDVVHINLASYGSTYRKLVIAAHARMLGIPYVLHLHGGEYAVFWSDKDSFINRRILSMFEKAERIIVLGRAWRDFVARRSALAAERVVIVPNATKAPPASGRGGGDAVHILFLGRIEKKKGIDELCEAFHAMKDLPGWRATIAGNGEEEALRLRLTELGLSQRVAVPGWQGPQAVSDLLLQADVLALPSHVENLPVSIIEAMAAGLAVVATPVGAVEDIVSDGETGLLVPPGDAAALKDALARLVQDPALRRRMGDAGRAVHRARLDMDPFAEAICDIWRSAAAKSRMET